MKGRRKNLKVRRGDFVMKYVPPMFGQPEKRRAIKVSRVGPDFIECGSTRYHLDGTHEQCDEFIYVDLPATIAYRERDREINRDNARRRAEAARIDAESRELFFAGLPARIEALENLVERLRDRIHDLEDQRNDH